MEGFFQRVLPAAGDYVVVAIRPDLPAGAQGKATDIRGIADQTRLVQTIRTLSTKPLDLYVAVGSYDKHRKNPRMKRALFLDLDAKHFAGRDLTKAEQTDSSIVFPFKADAARELAIFCRATGFPMPAIINDSGGGLHCYWPFDRDIGVEEWLVLAEALKAKCKAVEFHADHPITADAARVLRVPGTLNYKYGTPVPCRRLRDTGEVFTPSVLLEQLGGPVDTLFEGVVDKLSMPTNAPVENVLGGGLDAYVPPTADEVRSMLGCIQIQAGDGQWARILSGVHDWSQGSEEGFQIFHDWSKTQPGYASERDVRYRWRSFGKAGGFSRRNVTIATIVMMAKEAGYESPADDVPEVEAAEPEAPAAPVITLGQQVNAAFKTQIAAAAAAGNAQPGVKYVSQAKAIGLQRDPRTKVVFMNTANAKVAITSQLIGRFWFDTFLQKKLTNLPPLHDDAQVVPPRLWNDNDDVRVQVRIQQIVMPKVATETVRAAIDQLADENPQNCVVDWLETLEWDGQRRLSNLMRLGFGAPASRYYIRAGRNWLISMVARAYDPGCQVDTATILEGPQGGLKSSALRIIGGEHYRELTADPSTKDFEQQLRGVWLGEFAELATIRRAEDVQRLKQFITNRVDHYRPSYGRHEVDVKRTTVFCGTTNEGTWINDQTGARRFVPVAAGVIDLQWLRDNREQLFAEAVMLYKSHRTWWHWPKQLMEAMQAARTVVSPWFDDIFNYMKAQQVGAIISARDIAIRVLGITLAQQTHSTTTMIGIVLRKLGCTLVRHRIGGAITRSWVWNGVPK